MASPAPAPAAPAAAPAAPGADGQRRLTPAEARQADLQRRANAGESYMQLMQMIFAEKRKIQASESTLMQHEQDAVSMMTVNTRMYAVGYGSATGLTVGGLMRAINPSAFRARHRFWAWVAPSVAWGALQGMQTGARTSTIALLNLPESPFADKLITHLETHVPESPLLQEVSPTRKRANWCAPTDRRPPLPRAAQPSPWRRWCGRGIDAAPEQAQQQRAATAQQQQDERLRQQVLKNLRQQQQPAAQEPTPLPARPRGTPAVGLPSALPPSDGAGQALSTLDTGALAGDGAAAEVANEGQTWPDGLEEPDQPARPQRRGGRGGSGGLLREEHGGSGDVFGGVFGWSSGDGPEIDERPAEMGGGPAVGLTPEVLAAEGAEGRAARAAARRARRDQREREWASRRRQEQRVAQGQSWIRSGGSDAAGAEDEGAGGDGRRSPGRRRAARRQHGNGDSEGLDASHVT